LGFPWLHKHNLIIDWKKGEISWKPFRIDWRHLYKKGQRIRKEQQSKIEEVVDKEETKNRMTSPIEEDKMGVYIKLLEADVWNHKTNIATELKAARRLRKQIKDWYWKDITNIWIFSMKKRHINFLNQDLGTTRSK
jgi:Spy/CpxP family protein refolding chaperone